MERVGKASTRRERGEDGVTRVVVRSPFWAEARRALRQLIEEDPYPAAYYDPPAFEDDEEEEEEPDPAKLLAEIAKEDEERKREAEAAASEPEPDYGWVEGLDLEELRAALPTPPAEGHQRSGDTRAPSKI